MICLQRFIKASLKAWMESNDRAPLVLYGMRGVGKTHLIQTFAKENFHKIIYFNCKTEKKLLKCFARSLEPKVLIDKLNKFTQDVIESNSIIIFDDIDGFDNVVQALAYFASYRSDLFIVAITKDLSLKNFNYNLCHIDKINVLKLYPLSFYEFLCSLGQKSLVDYLNDISTIKNIDSFMCAHINEYLSKYLLTGGIPSIVSAYIESGFYSMQKAKEYYLEYFCESLKDCATNYQITKIAHVLKSICLSLDSLNKKFVYNIMDINGKSKAHDSILKILQDCSFIDKIILNTKPSLPFKEHDRHTSFALYLSDIALLSLFLDLKKEDDIFSTKKHAFVNNYLYQSLSKYFESIRFYYGTSPLGSIDFILNKGDDVIPCCVYLKGDRVPKILLKYKSEHRAHIKIVVVFTLDRFEVLRDVVFVPLFMVDRLYSLLDRAKAQSKNDLKDKMTKAEEIVNYEVVY